MAEIVGSVVAASVADFIDYSLWVVIVLLVYYAIKFFFVSPPSAEDRAARRAEEEENTDRLLNLGAGALKRRKKEREAEEDAAKKHRARKHREKFVKDAESALIKAIGHAEDIAYSLSRATDKDSKERAVSHAEDALDDLRSEIKRAARDLRKLRWRDRKYHEFFDRLYHFAGTALSLAEKIKIPQVMVSDWDQQATKIHDNMLGDQGVKAVCAVILHELERYVEEGHLEEVEEAATRRTTQEREQQEEEGEQQAEEREEQQEEREREAERTEEAAEAAATEESSGVDASGASGSAPRRSRKVRPKIIVRSKKAKEAARERAKEQAREAAKRKANAKVVVKPRGK